MKTKLLCFFRECRGYQYVATEFLNMDVSAWDGKNLVEIEVKVSIQDLKSDFNKDKWVFYSPDLVNSYCVPNKFYYAITKEISEKAIPLIEKQFPNFGIMIVNPVEIELRKESKLVTVVKESKFIHREVMSRENEMRFVSRVCGEIIYFRKKALERTV